MIIQNQNYFGSEHIFESICGKKLYLKKFRYTSFLSIFSTHLYPRQVAALFFLHEIIIMVSYNNR